MFRIDDATAASSLPAPEAAGTEGYFTEGNPTAGTPATNVRGSWLNMIQEELSAILAAAGITRSKTTYNQVNAALKSMYSSVVGTVRNLSMSVATASATATMTADEIIVETALGGQTYRLASFSKTINVATTGAGGMDTGTATANGFLAIYAIYNPTTGASALLGVNAAGGVRTNVYSGANMPAGYTASALVAVVPLTSGSLLAAGVVNDRRFSWGGSNLATGLTNGGVYTALSIAGSVPPNARRISGTLQAGSSVAGAYINLTVAANTAGFGSQTMGVYTQAGIPFIQNYALDLSAVQSMAYSFNCNSGTPSTTLTVTSYEI